MVHNNKSDPLIMSETTYKLRKFTNYFPVQVFQVYAAAARGQAEELQMWNADGTIGVSGELAGGTLNSLIVTTASSSSVCF